jgi:hypothetical protein
MEPRCCSLNTPGGKSGWGAAWWMAGGIEVSRSIPEVHRRETGLRSFSSSRPSAASALANNAEWVNWLPAPQASTFDPQWIARRIRIPPRIQWDYRNACFLPARSTAGSPGSSRESADHSGSRFEMNPHPEGRSGNDPVWKTLPISHLEIHEKHKKCQRMSPNLISDSKYELPDKAYK